MSASSSPVNCACSQRSKFSKKTRESSANYLYLIAGTPVLALLIAMAPALQAKNPWLLIDATTRGISGLLLQAVPFTLIGALVSAAVETWVTSKYIEKHAPKSTAGGFLLAIIAGVCVPVCDCVIVPTFSRLVARKLPLSCAVTFLCAVPVVNPISIWATWYAFYDVPAIVIMRIALGVAVAILVGLSFVIFPQKTPVLREKIMSDVDCACCEHNSPIPINRSFIGDIKRYVKHLMGDILVLLPIIVFGAAVASLIRAWLGSDPASRINATTALVAIPAMMLVAYASSLCSSSDAVIARSLAASLPMSSVMVFLLFGPMLDLKNTLMLVSDCKAKFVLRLTLTIAIMCFFAALLTNFAWGSALW
ncbi:permease [Gardnerella sp. 2492-Sm]|uniref:permease n=1 Tax=unclassified Gardnerella TaxID=2628112 RepID=UPI003D074746